MCLCPCGCACVRQARSLHLLPALSHCLGTPAQYLGHSLGSGSSAPPQQQAPAGQQQAPLGHRDPRVVATWLSALAQGQLNKAQQTGSVAFDLALACLGTAMFDEQQQQQPAGRAQPRGAGDQREAVALSAVQQLETSTLHALLKVRNSRH